MPNKDKTGPNGEGPLTGRGYGPCARKQKSNNRPRRKGRMRRNRKFKFGEPKDE